MKNEVKKWKVEYDHKDGRSGVVDVTTEIRDSASKYGNGKCGAIQINDGEQTVYDLRYNHGDLHMVMIEDWFGKGLVKTTLL